MRILFVAWQDPDGRRWYPVGCLSFDGTVYRFVYTRGALQAEKFSPFMRMKSLDKQYESKELFPIFSNRLLSRARQEYRTLLDWVNVAEERADPITMLELTGGSRGTDSLEVFPCPVPNEEGFYEVVFFCHGLSHLGEGAIERVKTLGPKDRLFLMPDMQNTADRFAIALRTADPATIVGYCPRYLNHDFHKLIQHCRDSVGVTVERVNLDAPLQMRLLCRLVSPWPEGFQPCSSESYEPLAGDQCLAGKYHQELQARTSAFSSTLSREHQAES